MADKTIVVLGCGIGGVAAALELRRRLPRGHRIVAIDRDSRASYPPSYLWLVVGERKPAHLSRDRARLARKGIEFVHAEVRQLDLEARVIWADSREFKYDYLVVALGMERSFDSVPGLAESTQSFVTLDGAERLAATLRYFAGGRIVIASAPGARFYPFAPYEAAMLIEDYFHGRKMRQKVEISLQTPDPDPLAVAGAEASETVLGLLAHKGIDIQRSKVLAAVDHARKEAVFEDESSTNFDLLVAQPETRAPRLLIESGLVQPGDWLRVNPSTMETGARDVFAVGDLAWTQAGPREPLFPAGEFAKEQALLAARQIAYRIDHGKQPSKATSKARFFVEVGAGAACSIEGRFVGGFAPEFKQPSIVWHWARQAVEKNWLLRTY